MYIYLESIPPTHIRIQVFAEINMQQPAPPPGPVAFTRMRKQPEREEKRREGFVISDA